MKKILICNLMTFSVFAMGMGYSYFNPQVLDLIAPEVTSEDYTAVRGPAGFLDYCVDVLAKSMHSLPAEKLVEQQRWQEAIWVLGESDPKAADKLEQELISKMKQAEKISGRQELPGGNNEGRVFFDNGISGVFKITGSRREVLAYKLSRMLGVNRVPITIMKTIDGQLGSFQLWVNDTKGPPKKLVEGLLDEDKAEVNAFLYLIDNTDFWNNNSNRLYTKDNRLLIFDNGLGFYDLKYEAPDLEEKKVLASREFFIKLKALDDAEIYKLFEEAALESRFARVFLQRRDFLLELARRHTLIR